MNPADEKFQLLDQWLGALREGILGDEQVAQLETLLAEDAEALDYYIDHAEMCAELCHYHGTTSSPDVFQGPMPVPRQNGLASHTSSAVASSEQTTTELTISRRWRSLALGIAATASLAAGVAIYVAVNQETRPTYTNVAGVAVLTRVAEAQWAGGQRIEVGDTLAVGTLQLDAGLAQIEFFAGAVVILEGPAKFELKSDERAMLHRGTLRSHVPMPAQGFIIETLGTRVIDHGTEFGLTVAADGRSEVHVFAGEVELQGAVAKRLTTGQGVRFDKSGQHETIAVDEEAFSGPATLAAGADAESLRQRTAWAKHSARLAADPAALLYFTFEHPDTWGRTLVDESSRPFHGAIVGSQWSQGRWPGKGALDFKRTSDRVRIDVPGKFDAFTLVAWIRFDGFDRWLSSPLLTDQYNAGRPHWHMTWNGEMVLGIGGDGNYFSARGLFDADDLGRWMHLATVVDLAARSVVHYLDGKTAHQARLRVVQKFQLGPAGVGNWSRHGVWKDDDIRSLNGRMDEFGIFARAFSAREIQQMYQQGKPQS